MSLETQLKSGIRVLDIRLKNVSDELLCYHGIQYLYDNFTDVLSTVTHFLDEHPRETVLMRVKKEQDDSAANLSFDQVFLNKYWVNYFNYFWQTLSGSTNPTLGDMRGKIVVLQDFDSSIGTFGMPYGGFTAQDDYSLADITHLYDKWTEVKTTLEDAAYVTGIESSNPGANQKYINYLSAYPGGSYPYFVASGHSDPSTDGPQLLTGLTTNSTFHTNEGTWPDFPRVGCVGTSCCRTCSIAYQGTDTLTADYLNNINNSRPNPQGELLNYWGIGIIMADFPGPRLIDTIIRQNGLYTTETTWQRGKPCLPPPSNGTNTLLADNGFNQLVWQGDGNLEIYGPRGARWATNSNSPTTSLMCFQGDGNLVVYDPAKPHGVAFASNTYNVGDRLVFQHDCNLVIYDSSGHPKWASGTNGCYQ